MSNLERWHDDQNPSDGENDVEDELLPHFLRPTAQSERRNEAARLDMAMAMTRDAGLENGARWAHSCASARWTWACALRSS